MSDLTGTIITVGGTPTVFVPLSSAWPSGTSSDAGCVSNIYLHTPVASPIQTFIAWDPLYGEAMVTAAQSCLPPAVSVWWAQPSSSLYTALGPEFACPEAYSAVQTAVVASSLHQTFCCPSQYTLLAPQSNVASEFPSQCVSVATSGQTFTHLASQGLTGQSTTTVVLSTSATVFAIPVNGFAFAVGPTLSIDTLTTHTSTVLPAALSGASTASRASSAPTQTSTSTTSSTSSSTHRATPASAAPPVGLYAGIAVALIIAAALFAAGAFFFLRRRRQQTVVEKHRSLAAAAALEEISKSPKELYCARLDSTTSYGSEVYELPDR